MTRDANGASWYALRYERDFVPRPQGVFPAWQFPVLGPELHFDTSRHVLELLPTKPAAELDVLPGFAVDVDGEVYRSDPAAGTVRVRRCDGSEVDLVCEPGVFARPAGLALDRRGYLYVADRMSGRVVVVQPDDGSVAGILADGLVEPVDVAVSPTGWIHVADRGAGTIVTFDARLRRRSAFAAVPEAGFPAGVTARPIAVMVDADGSLLIADANLPRLLRYRMDGERIGEVELARAVVEIGETELALTALERAYGRRMPLFLAGTCGPCRPDEDAGDRIAAVHRAIRLLLLRLPRRFEACGTWVSAALDGGAPGVEWHRVTIDADLPAGTWLKVQAVTADDPVTLNDPTLLPAGLAFAPPEDVSSCAVKPLAPWEVPDRLVQSPPGRYLRLRLVLGSDGTATPSIRSIRVFYPRVSYLDLLPRVYRRDPESALFLEHFLALFEFVLTDVEDRYEAFSRALDPAAAPAGVLEWLASLVDLVFDPSWPLERRRALLLEAVALYKIRGTVRGIERSIEIYTGVRPVVIEAFLERPFAPGWLGRPGFALGCNSALGHGHRDASAEALFDADAAHRFTILLPLPDACDAAVLLPVVDRIVMVNKPAHTVHTLRVVGANARVGVARVGLDLVLGSRQPERFHLGGCGEDARSEPRASVLGTNLVLGERRPQYARPASLEL